MSAAAKANRYSCEQVVEIEQEPRHHLVIENEFVRAFAVEIAPHDRTLCHHHPHDYVLYVAGDAEIVSAARDEQPKLLSYGDGECELLSAGMVHVVENRGTAAFRNVVVELLPGTGPMLRGAVPKLMQGEANTVEHFSDKRAAIFVVELSNAAEVEVSGPAVVASPYDAEVELISSGRAKAKVNHFNELRWIPTSVRATAVGREKDRARIVVVQIGMKI